MLFLDFGGLLQYSRWIVTKVIALASTIDDLYDAYGTIDELELFTSAIERLGTSK